MLRSRSFDYFTGDYVYSPTVWLENVTMNSFTLVYTYSYGSSDHTDTFLIKEYFERRPDLTGFPDTNDDSNDDTNDGTSGDVVDDSNDDENDDTNDDTSNDTDS